MSDCVAISFEWGIATLILVGYSVLPPYLYGRLFGLLGISFLTHSDAPSSVVDRIKCDRLGRKGIPSLTTRNRASVMTTSIEIHGTFAVAGFQSLAFILLICPQLLECQVSYYGDFSRRPH
jgi:hypothetical protein